MPPFVLRIFPKRKPERKANVQDQKLNSSCVSRLEKSGNSSEESKGADGLLASAADNDGDTVVTLAAGAALALGSRALGAALALGAGTLGATLALGAGTLRA